MGYNFTSFGLQTDDVVGFTESQRTAIEMQVTISIVDEAKLEYKNFRYPRYKNFYGYAQLMSGAFVSKEISLDYLNQEICHWQESSPGINQSIGCATKKILAALTPPSTATVTVGLLRQRYTSIRFRLLPLVKANIALNWHVLEPLCEDEIVQPPPQQGEPIPPNNGSADPGSRPSNQGGDKADRSNNDGGYNAGEGNPPPPIAGGNLVTAAWHWNVRACFVTCAGEYYSVRLPAFTNPVYKPVYVSTHPNVACPNATDGNLLENGVIIQPTTSVVESISFDYF